ncbi:MAG: FAD-binding dehydrogenase [Actinomycetales bacterium]
MTHADGTNAAATADVVVVGAGLAGLVVTAELVQAGHRVVLLDQEGEGSLGGQAWWSFGGLFLVDSPEQRRLRVRDSVELAWRDWEATAGFDRPEDHWPREWARSYVEFAAGEKRAWLRSLGVRFFPVVGWAERGGSGALGPGNSVPRFHIVWGTGPGVLEPFLQRVRDAVDRGLVTLLPRHRVAELVVSVVEGGRRRVTGVRGHRLVATDARRGETSSREVVGDFELAAQAVVLTSGGLGGDEERVRSLWPARLGTPPSRMLAGVPAHVDGSGVRAAVTAGARTINGDRMWHYVEGVHAPDPVWPRHGIRILPGPSALWLDATGHRLPAPFYPGFDTLGTLAHLRSTGHDHSWFVATREIAGKEFALSGSDQNPDLTGRSWRGVLARARTEVPTPLQRILDASGDAVVADDLPQLVAGMNALTGQELLDPAQVEREVRARDDEATAPFGKDAQLTAVRAARRYVGDRLVRVAAPHRLLDPAHGPLVALRLSVLTRKTLGGLETDLGGRVLDVAGQPVEGLFAAGEAAGFGGGGMHGYRALEGTFLGGCLYSGRVVASALSSQL